MRRERRIKGLLIALIAAACAGIVAFVLARCVFVLKSVVVEGSTTMADAEIIRLGKFDFGGAIGNVDPERVRENLESTGQLAVEEVSVERPSTVRIHVRERTRDALTLNGGHILVMDSDGYVIDNPTAMPESGGVYITGLEGTAYRIGKRISAPESKLSAMKTVLESIRKMDAAAYISEVNLTDLMEITAIARSGVIVKLGDTGNMDEKIRWLRSAVSDLDTRGETRGTLDVSSGTRADYRP